MSNIFSVDERYEEEAPFQIFWFTVNSIITLSLTFIFKMGREYFASFVLLRNSNFKNNPYDLLKVDELTLLEDRSDLLAKYFGIDIQIIDITILIIFSTGVFSQILFFLMKHFKCAEILVTQNKIQFETKLIDE